MKMISVFLLLAIASVFFCSVSIAETLLEKKADSTYSIFEKSALKQNIPPLPDDIHLDDMVIIKLVEEGGEIKISSIQKELKSLFPLPTNREISTNYLISYQDGDWNIVTVGENKKESLNIPFLLLLSNVFLTILARAITVNSRKSGELKLALASDLVIILSVALSAGVSAGVALSAGVDITIIVIAVVFVVVFVVGIVIEDLDAVAFGFLGTVAFAVAVVGGFYFIFQYLIFLGSVIIFSYLLLYLWGRTKEPSAKKNCT